MGSIIRKTRGWLEDRRLGSLRKRVAELDLAGMRQPLIVVFANWRYRDVLWNWMEAMGRIGVADCLVVALDRKLHEHVRRRGGRTILAPSGKTLTELWIARIEVFRCLIDSGIDFVHSDADAIWLRDPIPDYFEPEGELDLIASQGTRWPPEVFDQWGFVLCCGLFYMRSTPASAALLRRLRSHVEETGDDQKSLNQILLEMKIDWEFDSEYRVPFKKWHLRCSRQMIRSRGADIRVGALPFGRFPRLAEQQDRPYVVHPTTPKSPADKRAGLAEWNLWFRP
jgi:hypothetical protein